ncbi:hypothetical protein [Polyangium sorediatum]|uniref:Uncharacterized protein n=1 Tax=Polyangium sorediatum TaxID=889274 RepID=A0ABT6NK30_9BACT|nr:hypothetical protein [Polyangium sorediatum]MDI1428663.1 hypothetical protein [Polyangium sorediatum]
MQTHMWFPLQGRLLRMEEDEILHSKEKNLRSKVNGLFLWR